MESPRPNGRGAEIAPLEVLYGGPPLLLDERSLLRDAIGPLLARARSADFAVARFRLGAIDLRGAELAGLERCRLLIERVQAVSDGDALAASRGEVRGRLALMAAFLESGRVEVRAAGGPCWAPDFSLLKDVSRADAAPPVCVGVLGAHFFARPYPVTGPALTHITADPAATAVLGERFEELWQGGYDVGFVIAERLRRLLGGRPAQPPVVREAAAPTGAAVAWRALQARFGKAPPARPASRVLELAEFQADAVARAGEALRRWGGVVLADGVGLGKTYMALALVEAELRAGGTVLVTAPAALRKEWLGPLRRLARARGATLAAARDAGPARLRWISHALLSRGIELPGPPPTLVVVDEAHAFRNSATRRYRALASMCRQGRVAELTATPLNNALWDLYFQLRLFAGDSTFASVGVPDLRQAFRAGEAVGDVRAIAPVLREVVVRRTRPFLRDHYGTVSLPDGRALSLPRRASPRPIRYALATALSGGVAGLVSLVEGLRLAPYDLDNYRLVASGDGSGDGSVPSPGPGGGRAEPAGERGSSASVAGPVNGRYRLAGELLRCGLLKRLESSGGAFRVSVRGLAAFLEAFAQELDAGRLLRPRDRALLAGEQLMLGALALAPAPAWLDSSRVLADVRADLEALRQLLRALPEGAHDAKRECLRRLVAELVGRGEKVVVFTEYRETARGLAGSLAAHRVGLVHGGGAWMGQSPVGRRELIERFAPHANGARSPAAHERVDVLVATDVLAEGLNLQDARCVVSYDLPWNPVRLMQRIGRVDRLGSPHEEVEPYHFVPETGLDELLGLMRRIRRKVRLIRRALPGEPEVLDAEVGDRGDPWLRRILAGDGTALEAAERAETAPFEVEDRLRRLWHATVARVPRANGPAAPATAPLAVCVETAADTEAGILLCFEGAGRCAWLVCDDAPQHARDDDLAAARILATALAAAGAAPLDPGTLAVAEAAGRRLLQERAAQPPAANGVAARAVRQILKELARERQRPDPARCARADLLLARLRQGLKAGEEIALSEVLRVVPDGADVLARFERATTRAPAERATGGDGGGQTHVPTRVALELARPGVDGPDPWGVRWRLVAAIQVRPAATPAAPSTGAAPSS